MIGSPDYGSMYFFESLPAPMEVVYRPRRTKSFVNDFVSLLGRDGLALGVHTRKILVQAIKNFLTPLRGDIFGFVNHRLIGSIHAYVQIVDE